MTKLENFVPGKFPNIQYGISNNLQPAQSDVVMLIFNVYPVGIIWNLIY